MPMPSAYETRSEAFFRLYEGETPQEIQTLLTRWIPKGSRVLELGCGSGRDARFMSGLDAIVEATDGSGPLLKLAEARAQALLGAESPSFSLLCLPPDKASEDALFARLPRFDAVYTCGVLQHLSDHELYEAACFMERAVTDKGTLIVVVPLDHKGDPDRKTFLRDSLDYATLFERMGFRLASQEIRDGVGSPGHECRWASCVFLRDSQSELSNRRFRHILEKDAKTSTYKLALLRALCDINRTMPRSVRFDNGKALVPLGLIAERWIRDYWQLASGPRMPRQIHQNRELGFGTALERTMTICHSQYGVFESLMRNEARSKDQTSLLQQLFDDVVTTALKGPIHYIQDDGRNPVFTYVATHTGRRPPFTGRGSIIERYGLLAFPAELWLELNRIAPWLEDSLILEWARLSARFESLCSGEHVLTQADIVVRLLPPESARDTDFAASAYKAAISRGSLRSVWSGTPLKAQTLAVDHMLPWARFHCNDLWNLMPADRVENGRKSDAIPSADILHDSRDRIFSNWALLSSLAPTRFASEAEIALTRTPLPKLHWETPLFDAFLETADMAARQLQSARWP